MWSPPAGAEVRSPATGRVEYVGPLKGFRLVAILRLEGEWRVVLAGLQTVTAPAGARVRAGQPIGRAAAGPARALYLQLRDGARAVDPAPQLAGPAPPR